MKVNLTMDQNVKIELTKKLEDIESNLKTLLQTRDNIPIGLHGGLGGMVLFYYYYYFYTKKKKYLSFAEELLERTLTIPSGNNYTFCSGMSGIGWLVQHLHSNKLLDINPNEILNDLDEELVDIAVAEFKKGNYDFLHGSSGILYYFLNRISSSKKCEEFIAQIVKTVESTAIFTDTTCSWPLVDEAGSQFNMGISHGIPAITILLAKSYSLGILPEKSKRMADMSLRFIKDNANRANSTWCYPYVANDKSDSGRLAWCYGDLSVATSLYFSGRLLGNDFWIEEANRVMQLTLSKREAFTSGVVDSCLCHGTSGVSHIYQVFFNETGNIAYKNAADFWLNKTLKFSAFDDGIAGYLMWDNKIGWNKNAGLLEGVTGVGLSIIAALSPELTGWNKCLLINP